MTIIPPVKSMAPTAVKTLSTVTGVQRYQVKTIREDSDEKELCKISLPY